jgi:hypothetical protein
MQGRNNFLDVRIACHYEVKPACDHVDAEVDRARLFDDLVDARMGIPACSGKGGGIDPAPEGVGGDIAIDGDGNAWMVNGALAEFSNSGAPISSSTGYKGPGAPKGIALDGSGNLWATGSIGTVVGNFTSLNIFEFIGASAPVVTPIASGVKNSTLGTRP